MPPNELTALYKIKKHRGTICTKNTKKQFFQLCYTYIESTTERKQRSTGKDTILKLKHFKPFTVEKKKSKTVFSLSLQTYEPYS